MNLKEMRDLYEYDRWANARVLESVATLTPDQFTRDLGASFGGIHGTLVHMLSADRVWLNRWLGRPAAPLKSEDIPTIEVLKKQWDAHGLELGNFLRTLTEEKLAASCSYSDFKGTPNSQTLWQQMQHKVNHSTYHRGQVVTMIRQLGAKAQGTDLITYLRLKERDA